MGLFYDSLVVVSVVHVKIYASLSAPDVGVAYTKVIATVFLSKRAGLFPVGLPNTRYAHAGCDMIRRRMLT